MTKPPLPDNPITDFMNSDFSGTFDWSLPAMMLISTALVAVYVGAAVAIRGRNQASLRAPRRRTSLSAWPSRRPSAASLS
ncbi:hypothetical protein [Paenarthrobacter nitroguajacolicus]|uniref:hypothetical protein n=1 Tax=Paenarthrobacter nitroguajacolicus TaxID=211146 RepID=UPI001111FC84|nr:hypothetical protein [Paenarthrobacter nitroguajacolicus]